jgi:hypothetical protein
LASSLKRPANSLLQPVMCDSIPNTCLRSSIVPSLVAWARQPPLTSLPDRVTAGQWTPVASLTSSRFWADADEAAKAIAADAAIASSTSLRRLRILSP